MEWHDIHEVHKLIMFLSDLICQYNRLGDTPGFFGAVNQSDHGQCEFESGTGALACQNPPINNGSLIHPVS